MLTENSRVHNKPKSCSGSELKFLSRVAGGYGTTGCRAICDLDGTR